MEGSGDSNSQKEEGELSDDDNELDNELEKFTHDDQNMHPKDNSSSFRESNIVPRQNNRVNNVWQNFRQPPPNFIPNYQSSPLSTWDYNHGMGLLRYDRIRPSPIPPLQKWDHRENRPRVPNRPPFPPSLPRSRHYNNPMEYRSHPSQQNNRFGKKYMTSVYAKIAILCIWNKLYRGNII